MSRRFFVFFYRFIFTNFRSLAGYLRLALGGASMDENDEEPSAEAGGGVEGSDTEPRPRGWSPEQGAITAEGCPAEGFGSQQRSDSAWMTEEEEVEEEEESVNETTDKFYCSYDSTWENEEGEREKKTASRRPLTFFNSVSEPSTAQTSGLRA